jgi:hypothetical protein
MTLWLRVALFVLTFGAVCVFATAYEYRVISRRRAFDWSSDPNWLTMSILAVAFSYFLFR